MKIITIDEAKEKLMNICPSMYIRFLGDLRYDNVIKEDCSAYESHGAIIFKFKWISASDWYICDLGDSDMPAAVKEARETFNYDVRTEEIYFLKDIPENYDFGKLRVRLKFARIGDKFSYNDSNIRLLAKNDAEQMRALTTTPDNDSDMSKKIARYIMDNFQNFLDYGESSETDLLGIFDGITLAGAVSIADRWGELNYINNIFVSCDYRGRKYATRLLRAATSMYPEAIYTYECENNNFASIATAKSAGYNFVGTMCVDW
jgi:ribosomal protein S18 acetylase RimI-like enzyme